VIRVHHPPFGVLENLPIGANGVKSRERRLTIIRCFGDKGDVEDITEGIFFQRSSTWPKLAKLQSVH
jgi:hypothetical protein